MRALAVQPDDDLRDRLDSHLATRTDGTGAPSENDVLCELLRRGLATTEADAHGDQLPADERDAISDRVDDVVDALYAQERAV